MTPFEVALLEELCRSRITLSAVVLASDLADRGAVSMYGDPYGLVAWTLGNLNERGLVIYREGYSGCPVEIRVTAKGYAAVGYTVIRPIVGRRTYYHDSAARRSGDATDFLNYESTATGGAIERMSLADHIDYYPDHRELHRAQLEELMTRRATPQELEVIRQRSAEGKSNVEIGREIGMHPSDVSRNKPADIKRRSLKTELLDLIASEGKIESARSLGKLLALRGRPGEDIHNITHCLNMLERQGLVSFVRHHKDGDYSRIEPTKMGLVATAAVTAPAVVRDVRVRELMPTDEQEEVHEVATEVRRPAPVAPENAPSAPEPDRPDAEAYPELARLRRHRSEHAEASKRAEGYLNAALALEDIDPNEAARLTDMANEAAQYSSLSPVEDEYLRYAEAYKPWRQTR